MDYNSQRKLLRAGFVIIEKGWAPLCIRRKRRDWREWEVVKRYVSERELDRDLAQMLRDPRVIKL